MGWTGPACGNVTSASIGFQDKHEPSSSEGRASAPNVTPYGGRSGSKKAMIDALMITTLTTPLTITGELRANV